MVYVHVYIYTFDGFVLLPLKRAYVLFNKAILVLVLSIRSTDVKVNAHTGISATLMFDDYIDNNTSDNDYDVHHTKTVNP